MNTRTTILSVCIATSLAAVFSGCASDHHGSSSGSGDPSAMGATAGAPQLMFDSPQAAVDALVDGARRCDRAYLRELFGPEVDGLTTGDKGQDDVDLQVFVVAYDVYHTLNRNADGTYSLVMGEHEWVFPAPIARAGKDWYFDTAAGVNEVITRTIGVNELNLIEALDVFVAAQEEFYQMDPDGDSVHDYAATLRSAPGKRDGLYWPDEEGSPMSPLGPLVARAVESGELNPDVEGRPPYRGYYFRILTSQGSGAVGGAMNYIDNSGRMTRGYALIAWPASYNETGVMTFIVSKVDVVYQKDLGTNTAAEAARITSFDPSDGWLPVE